MTMTGEGLPFLQHLSPDSRTPQRSASAMPTPQTRTPSPSVEKHPPAHAPPPPPQEVAKSESRSPGIQSPRASQLFQDAPSSTSPPHPLRLVLLFHRVFACALSLGVLGLVGSLAAAYRREDETAPPGLQLIIANVGLAFCSRPNASLFAPPRP